MPGLDRVQDDGPGIQRRRRVMAGLNVNETQVFRPEVS